MSLNIYGIIASPFNIDNNYHLDVIDSFASHLAEPFEDHISYEDVLDSIQYRHNDTDSTFIERVVTNVHHRMRHFWVDDVRKNPRLFGLHPYRVFSFDFIPFEIPIEENWIIWLLKKIPLPWGLNDRLLGFGISEISDYNLALKRGIGLCSQYSKIICEIFDKHEIESYYIGLEGHVVCEAKVDTKLHVCDADFGIIIPHSLKFIENNLDTVKHYYISSGINKSLASDYAELYNADGNNRTRYKKSKKQTFLLQCYYILKWLIPIAGFCVSGLLLMKLSSQLTKIIT